jgi:deoxyadenosine/deoxycytidine kinase
VSEVAARRYIAVEGPPGVGKSAFCRALAGRLGARAVLEPGPNPFPPGFQSQLYGLLSRHQQSDQFQQEDLFAAGVVSDFLFDCDRILAHVHLSRDELALYEKVYHLLGREMPRADLVVYLQAKPEVLVQRLRKRDANVPTRDSVERVAQAYAEFFFHWSDSPLLVVNTSEIDFVERRADLDDLVAVIQKTRNGVTHYSPLGSR